jgi:Archaeal putative transposase ISC1217
LTRDPAGRREPKAYFSTDIQEEAEEIIGSFIKRWTIEVTFEESRAHLGIETQRQWSDLAIERSTPGLLGLYSLVALFGKRLYPDGKIPVHRTAWYRKKEATFSDVLGVVRRELWGNFTYRTSAQEPDVLLVPRSHMDRFAYALCY